jgi:hypothetical protein
MLVNLLASIQSEYSDFLIQSTTTLWRQMKRPCFSYKQTIKAPVPLDSTSFVAQLAACFRRLDKLRADNAHIYFHDETWCSTGKETRSIWLDEVGIGCMRKQDGKGERLAISAMIDKTGFHKETIDMFTCDADHSMVWVLCFYKQI